MSKNQIYIISAIAIIVILGGILALTTGNKSGKTETIAIPSSNVQQIGQITQKEGYKPTLQGLNVKYDNDKINISYPRAKLDQKILGEEIGKIIEPLNLPKDDNVTFILAIAGNEVFQNDRNKGCTFTSPNPVYCFHLINVSGIVNITLQKGTIEEAKPILKEIKFGQTFENNDFTLQVEEAKWTDALTSKNPYTLPLKAKNKILSIKLTGQNNGKVADSARLSGMKVKTLKDLEFDQLSNTYSFNQIDKADLPTGFDGCLSCKVNPSDKAKEYIYFDLAEKPLTDLYLISGDNKILLN